MPLPSDDGVDFDEAILASLDNGIVGVADCQRLGQRIQDGAVQDGVTGVHAGDEAVSEQETDAVNIWSRV